MNFYHLRKLIYFAIFIAAAQTDGLRRIDLYEGLVHTPVLQQSRNLDLAPPYHSTRISPESTVLVKFGDIYYEENKRINSSQSVMSVILSLDESGFFGDIFGDTEITGFSCLPSYCQEDESSSVYISSLWIQGAASHITLNTTLSIADEAWQLKVPALYFKEIPALINSMSSLSIGWIGLGTGSGSNKNFKDGNLVFSLFYNYSSQVQSLIFGFNESLADMSKPPLVLNSQPNWHLELVSLSVGDHLVYSDDLGTTIVEFALTMTDIIFPTEITDIILDQLTQLGLNCNGKNCISTNLSDFVPIILTFSDGAQMKIDPKIYTGQNTAPDGSTFYHTIPFYAQKSSRSQKNYLIFGRNILNHYYSVFQMLNGANTITLYSAASGSSDNQVLQYSQFASNESEVKNSLDAHKIIFFLIGIGVVVLVIFACWSAFWMLKKWLEKARNYRIYAVDMELSKQEYDHQTLS